jgi:hypothetical protein
MVDYNTKNALGTLALNYELFVAGTYYESESTFLDAATAGYVPAIGDILCYKTDDTNKHQKYDRTDAALVIMGIIHEIRTDNTTPTAVQELSFAKNASVHYAALGLTGTMDAAQILTLKEALRAKNINMVQE